MAKVTVVSDPWKFVVKQGDLYLRRETLLAVTTEHQAVPAASEARTDASPVTTLVDLFQRKLVADYSIDQIATAPIPESQLRPLLASLCTRITVIAPIDDVADTRGVPKAPESANARSVWAAVLRRAIVSIVLTGGTAATISGAGLAVAPDEAVPRLIGLLPQVGAMTLGFVVLSLAAAVAATRNIGRTSFPRRLKYLVPVMGLATTTATCSWIASSAGVPDLHWLGLAGGLAANLATFGRLADDEAHVLAAFDPGYTQGPILGWIGVNQRTWAAATFLSAASGIGAVAIYRGGAGAVLAFGALGVAIALRAIANRFR